MTNLDVESLIEEVMEGEPISFVQVPNTILDITGRIGDNDFVVEDNPPLSKTSNDEKGKSSNHCVLDLQVL